MSWKDDRDALIAQTMAFVQSVTSRRQSGPDAIKPSLPPVADAPDSGSAPQATTPFAQVKVAELPAGVVGHAPHPIAPGEVASEIRARIAGFRARQERFNREREEYFSKTLAKLKATLEEMPRPRSNK